MGSEAACTLRLDGRATRGAALLEQRELIFRGAFRLAIALAEIQSARADGGSLAIRFGGRTATFELGPLAAKWAEKIIHPRSRADKLGVRPGATVLLAGSLDAAFRAELERREATIVARAPSGGVDLVFFAAEDPSTLNRLEGLRVAIKPNGAIWVVRPKGRAGVSESAVMAAGKRAGLVDVKVVSFSDTHTAEKFVIPVAKRIPRKTGPKRASSRAAAQLARPGTRRAKTGGV
jgi:hypothetical protein